ncbi:SRPBCC domain-containing protein [Virgibacillus sp. NKC19-3]|uniref:SRPBCC family protein n=1 Tax=Virgibacillus saliphilus TaxID=2831674 RepID=UPI001C9B5740|nr:SRPBCC domain-containing protein [Virgibacillus sp. NKC19-3]MBY7142115.1 SRPBCC domain-containing protein [Virgibacillus sp. NKC19-3]
MATLIVTDEIIIHAPLSRVWEVLTLSKYVRKWDDLPVDFQEEALCMGSEMMWFFPDGGYAKNTVIKVKHQKEMQIALYVSNWNVNPNPGEIMYSYEILTHGNGTRLRLRHGDFSLLTNGKDFQKASAEFSHVAKRKIKQLAEA